MTWEVHLSRRSSHATYLVTVTHHEKELWRSFKIKNESEAIVVFTHIDSLLHKLTKEGFVYNPKTEMMHQLEIEE